MIRGSLRKLFNVYKCSKIMIYIYSLFLLFFALYFGGNENILAKNVYIYFRRPWSTIAPTNAKIDQKHNLLRAYFVRVAANKQSNTCNNQSTKTEVHRNLCTREGALWVICSTIFNLGVRTLRIH